MPALALDIGTYSLKAVSGRPGSKPLIERSAEQFNTTNLAVANDEAQIDKLAELLENFLQDHKLPRTDVRLSLPESEISTKVITLPSLSDSELASAIGWQAEQHIPIPKEELSLQYQVLFRPSHRDRQQPMRVLLIGTKKTVVEHLTEVFLKIGIEPTLMETQLLSVLRNLQIGADEPPTLIAHFGASNLIMAAVNQGELVFVFNHPSGGQLLTKALEQGLGLDPSQAEDYKRRYGIEPNQLEGKVKAALMPSLDNFLTEMKKAINYFDSHLPEQKVKRIVMSGGSSQLPGLIEYFTQNLGLETLLAAPFAMAKGELPATNHQAMSVCMGLLMREL